MTEKHGGMYIRMIDGDDKSEGGTFFAVIKNSDDPTEDTPKFDAAYFIQDKDRSVGLAMLKNVLELAAHMAKTLHKIGPDSESNEQD